MKAPLGRYEEKASVGPGKVVPAILTLGARVMPDGMLRYPTPENAEAAASGN